MKKEEWNNFYRLRENFKTEIEKISALVPGLKKIQQLFADGRAENARYRVETAVVYNTALDDVTIDDDIKLILVADNPGRREQAAENRRYLVGPSGKIAAKFFRDNPCLGIDFLKNVIILNKTPIHSARTAELKQLCAMDETGCLSKAVEESQVFMALLLLEFQKALGCQVWITGYGEMKKGGLFQVYTEKLKEIYSKDDDLYKQLYFFRHFSMNQFTIDLKQQSLSLGGGAESVAKTLKRMGSAYRKRILEVEIKHEQRRGHSS